MKRCFRIVLLLWLLLGDIGPSLAQEQHQAGLVVDFGDGRVRVRVVSFAEETISGVDLLRRSGLDVAMVSGGLGTAICAIEGVGCPPTPQECFCECRGGTCRYWAYFHLRDGAWVYADRGAADRRLGDGDVDGWVWGDGRTPPPLLTWEEIRAASLLPTPTAVSPPAGGPSAPTSPPALSPTETLTPTARADTPGGHVPTRTPAARAVDTPGGYSPTGRPTLSLSARPLSSASATALPTESASPSGGLFSPTALAFGGMVLLLLGLALWARRRR